MPKKASRKDTVDIVKLPDLWKSDFQKSTMRTNFVLALSQPMIEFLCAVAENVHWDRARYLTIHAPDNWIATEHALIKRGLIVRKPLSQLDAERDAIQEAGGDPRLDKSCCTLTPAGEAVVSLFRVTGIFVDSDNAQLKKASQQ